MKRMYPRLKPLEMRLVEIGHLDVGDAALAHLELIPDTIIGRTCPGGDHLERITGLEHLLDGADLLFVALRPHTNSTERDRGIRLELFFSGVVETLDILP